MTVCVAAISEQSNSIIGASDRMLTAGIVQFQPPVSKTYQLTSSIAVMVAGEMSIQAEIVADLRQRITSLLKSTPNPDWLNVKDVAAMYADLYKGIKARKAEADILAPLGLTTETFISRQQQLAPDVAMSLSTELIGKELPATAALVVGVDNFGAHIYQIENGNYSCQDAAGFAAVGAGWYHANSHLMFSRHGKDGGLSRTLLLVYTAKKRAEVAPGVGVETDMFAIRGLGNFFGIGDHVIRGFQKTYEQSVTAHARVELRAEKQANEFIEQITKQTDEAGQTDQQNVVGTTSAEEEGEHKA